MEIQLQELIDQIKQDGVKAAETEAAAILTAAKEEAEKIINEANKKASKILQDAKDETERMVRSGEDAITQAGRNVLISFRESVTKELKAIVGEKVNNLYSSDEVAKIIVDVLVALGQNTETDDIAIVLNSADLEKLENALISELKAKMLSGVTLKPNDNFDGGFRIAVNGGEVYYDYSAESVVEMLSNYLSPKVTALLKEAE
jgi:V/A-type H+-transporting ATPase subunit E